MSLEFRSAQDEGTPMTGLARRLCAVLALVAWAAAGQAAPVKTPHVTAELVAQRSAVQPGQTLQIGLRLQHIPHWHTYWRNPGDSGLPTTLAWTVPPGSSVGEIAWPAPKRLPIGPLVNFGYEDELLLPLAFTAPADAKPGSTLTLSAKADWLVCNDVCIPETAQLELALPVVDGKTTPGTSAHESLFVRTAAQQPGPWPGGTASLQQAGNELLLTLEWAGAPSPSAQAPAVQVFPYAEQLLEPARHELYQTPNGYALKLALMDGATLPATLAGIAVAQGDLSTGATGAAAVWGGSKRAVEFSAPVRTVAALQLPTGARLLAAEPVQALGGAGGAGSASAQAGLASVGVLAALALAFVGGMLLNLMPCVFPVLSIKLLSLAQQGSEPRALRTHAGAYTGGVVLSFVALAAALLALRAAGSAVGWGFQLQEPGVVFVLALLFFALGLNLMGAFELGNLVPQRLAAWRSQRPSVDAFASGVLAVVAASPCTAPFMGAALGFAISQSAAVALAVFAVLGLGMALPYVLLVLLPGWRARLPRPGPWMLHLKQGLAFPMFATVVWLVWVLGQQAGIDGAARLLLALVGLGALVWLIGLPLLRGGSGAWRGVVGVVGQAFGALALVGLLAWGWPGTAQDALANPVSGSPAKSNATGQGATWQAYDETVLARHIAQGQPVFVDFTAAWCVSCQVNKRLVLSTDSTLRAFEQANVVLMRADWTRRDANITQALARLGRNGVPVYALIAPGRSPVLLPEILTERIVRDALANLPPPRS
jgi:thiol:disulfide interchange protein